MTRKIIYTAFDGDYMIYIDCMRELAIRNGAIPINPEHALGYYLSTRAHNDLKVEVMKDCLSLVNISDELWVFADSNNENMTLSSLPEGVIVEILLLAWRGKASIKVFSIPKSLECLKAGTPYAGVARDIEKFDIGIHFDKQYFDEISKFITDAMPALRPVVLIDICNEDFKYVDWVRAFAYRLSFVPIAPQHIIPKVVYDRYGMSDRYNNDVIILQNSVAEIWAIFRSRKDLRMLKSKYAPFSGSKITFIPVQHLNIPKYSDPANWSITTKEYIASIDILKM